MLVGRTAECARIVQVLADARAGSSGALLSRGEPGIGKSALLRYAAADVAGRMNVLTAKGIESEAEIPFAGLFELITHRVATI